MEKSTVVGIGLGIFSIGVGMVLKNVNVAALANPAAILIIFLGTAASLFNSFPMEDIKKFPMLVKQLFKQQELPAKSELLKLFVELSQIARREGLLSLESRMKEITDPFLKNGMEMVIDGMDPDFVRDVLEAEIHAMEDRHRTGSIQPGWYAPTLGVLGAVIGLIAALGNLNDIDVMGHSIAAAFVATLFGIFSGYVMWHPFSNKLKMMSKVEVEIKKMIIEGI